MLLTCHHVIPSKDVARKSTIYFDRENSSSPGVSVRGADLFDLDSEDSFVTRVDKSEKVSQSPDVLCLRATMHVSIYSRTCIIKCGHLGTTKSVFITEVLLWVGFREYFEESYTLKNITKR